jgi:predicted SprT family Zn-dependent metalloprotease
VTPKKLQASVRRWGLQWAVPDLANVVTIEFSTRMRRSLGRCHPASGRIRLASFLLQEPPSVLKEVLCHEVAHVAVYQLFGASAKPHGVAWTELVRRAGFEPRTRARAMIGKVAKTAPPPSAPIPDVITRYEHRCPVCHTVRSSRRPVPRWRCAECVDAGLAGTMVISRVVFDLAQGR